MVRYAWKLDGEKVIHPQPPEDISSGSPVGAPEGWQAHRVACYFEHPIPIRGVTPCEIRHESLPPEFPSNFIRHDGTVHPFTERQDHEQIHRQHSPKNQADQQAENYPKARGPLERCGPYGGHRLRQVTGTSKNSQTKEHSGQVQRRQEKAGDGARSSQPGDD